MIVINYKVLKYSGEALPLLQHNKLGKRVTGGVFSMEQAKSQMPAPMWPNPQATEK